ncbi:hypothetical protein HAX54_011997 [Datura stramonium]|uniref:Uncharacterized protein n=1 Tax=Datura stramonium TaxID=4076 RepID=A0ABS8TKX1_DATST|nr:hypothetical protein [Datura stramonium]
MQGRVPPGKASRLLPKSGHRPVMRLVEDSLPIPRGVGQPTRSDLRNSLLILLVRRSRRTPVSSSLTEPCLFDFFPSLFPASLDKASSLIDRVGVRSESQG